MDEIVQNVPSALALEEELRERNRELAALNDLAMAIASSLDLDDTLQVALMRTLDLVNVKCGGIALLERDSGKLVEGIAVGLTREALTCSLSKLCASRGAPLILSDTAERQDMPVEYAGMRSAAVVPLKSSGRTVGVLTVLDEKPKRISQRDVSLLSAVASLVGPAVENAGLFAELSDKVVEVTALNAIAQSISRRLDLSAILESCLAEIRTLVPFERASVVLVDEKNPSRLVIQAVAGTIPQPGVGATYEVERTFLSTVMKARRSTVITEVCEADDRIAEELWGQGVRSWVIVPLLDEGNVIGSLDVSSYDPEAYGFRQVCVLEGVAGHLSVAVSNARLYESVRRRTLELETLARETQHRVQNNLQMISGLVGMIGSDSEVPSKSVSRCLSQIQAISVIHEMLSSEQDIGEVALMGSVERIARMAAVAASGDKNVSVEVCGEDIRLPSKYASAIGIAINELVTNAIEHGFKDRNKGRIRIEIRPTAARTEILVHDDGSGLSDGFCLDNVRGSGLEVLSMLLKQGLGGTLDLESSQGTLARITIKS